MLKDKYLELIGSLTKLTESGLLKWSESTPKSDNKYKRLMCAVGDDQTLFKMEIKFQLGDEKWQKQKNPDLLIENKSLPDEMMYITGFKTNGETEKLRDSILNKYCQDMIPSIEDIKTVLDEIIMGISVSEFRNQRIIKIIN